MKSLSHCRTIILAILAIILSATVIKAADFYVDPVNGSMSNDGSQAHPWSTMQEVWVQNKIQTKQWVRPYNDTTKLMADKNIGAHVQPGDTIYLLSGYHGELDIQGAINSDWITVKAAQGATPTFRKIFLRAVSKWAFDGISVSFSYSGAAYLSSDKMFTVETHSNYGPSSYVTLKNSKVFSQPSVSGWIAQDWLDLAASGIYIFYTPHVIIDNVNVSVVDMGITLYGSLNGIIRNCTIDKVRGDGIRLPGSNYSVIEYNTVKNSYQVDDNHNDLIQSWAINDNLLYPDWFDYGGLNPTYGIEIRGNTLIAHEDVNQTFKQEVQGIGFFDGWFEDFVIENNLIVSNTTHGITLTGTRNSRITNNTAVYTDPNIGTQYSAIRVLPHKDRTAGYGNIVRNNLCSLLATTTTFSSPTETVSGGVVVENNIITVANSEHFVDPANFDFRLKETSTAINAGSTTMAPMIDITQAQRDASPDIGAYEYRQAHDIVAPQNFIFKN